MEGHPHGAMRRKDREITERTEIDTILTSTNVMHLALADGDVPFLVPVFYVYDGTSICFHSASAGTKIEILKRNPKVCFEVSIDHGVIESEQACDFRSQTPHSDRVWEGKFRRGRSREGADSQSNC